MGKSNPKLYKLINCLGLLKSPHSQTPQGRVKMTLAAEAETPRVVSYNCERHLVSQEVILLHGQCQDQVLKPSKVMHRELYKINAVMNLNGPLFCHSGPVTPFLDCPSISKYLSSWSLVLGGLVNKKMDKHVHSTQKFTLGRQ